MRRMKRFEETSKSRARDFGEHFGHLPFHNLALKYAFLLRSTFLQLNVTATFKSLMGNRAVLEISDFCKLLSHFDEIFSRF